MPGDEWFAASDSLVSEICGGEKQQWGKRPAEYSLCSLAIIPRDWRLFRNAEMARDVRDVYYSHLACTRLAESRSLTRSLFVYSLFEIRLRRWWDTSVGPFRSVHMQLRQRETTWLQAHSFTLRGTLINLTHSHSVYYAFANLSFEISTRPAFSLQRSHAKRANEKAALCSYRSGDEFTSMLNVLHIQRIVVASLIFVYINEP